MSSNLELELSKQFKASQEKYVYFLLVVAASAIGFAMTQSKVEPIEYRHIPLALAVIFWAVSFVSGLRFIKFATSFTFQNQNYLAFKRELKKYPQEIAQELRFKFKSGLDETTGKQQDKMKLYGNLQSLLLLMGAFSYITWHILRMYHLTT